MARTAKSRIGLWVWPTVVVLMLIGMIGEARTHVQPADAEPHMQRCKAAMTEIPLNITGRYGTWAGTKTEIPMAATKLLRPNEIFSATYTKLGTGESVAMLIVDCRDARDLEGHYPPRCYPANGESEISRIPKLWTLGNMAIPGMEYHFASEGQMDDEKVVYNFFVSPKVPGVIVSHPELDGVICRDIGSIYKSGEDYQRRYYGAAEFQLVTSAQMPAEQRDQAFEDLLTPDIGLICTLMNRDSGGK